MLNASLRILNQKSSRKYQELEKLSAAGALCASLLRLIPFMPFGCTPTYGLRVLAFDLDPFDAAEHRSIHWVKQKFV